MSRSLDVFKFRAFHKPTNMMYADVSFRKIKGLFDDPLKIIIDTRGGEELTYLATDVILMQWTGLTDSKGVDVYEGDIMIHNGEKRVIAWHKDRAEFYMKILNHDGYYGDLNKWTIVKDNIIGSIHTEDK